jgi:hypothetical protein
MTADRPNTPGFDFHLDIKFTVTKNGKRRATYFSRRALRWLPVPVANADLFVAQGLATEYRRIKEAA